MGWSETWIAHPIHQFIIIVPKCLLNLHELAINWGCQGIHFQSYTQIVYITAFDHQPINLSLDLYIIYLVYPHISDGEKYEKYD
jgi:hypothetical protein